MQKFTATESQWSKKDWQELLPKDGTLTAVVGPYQHPPGEPPSIDNPREVLALVWGNTAKETKALARLFAAAPAMKAALEEMESVLNIARIISNRHHAGAPIDAELWSALHQYLNEAHTTRNNALALAEGKEADA